MSESARKSSSLAIIEKKPHIQRPGGCVGIFFQLFDWNRRFAKKKFFPKKLLPPVRTKVSKKFNAEEKLPVAKHLLITDEDNSGGFSSKMKKNGSFEPKKTEMQAPGLVARLMGLEAMPVPIVEQNESSKSSLKDVSKAKGDKFGGRSENVSAKELSLSPEKGNLRPQKIQKTGVSDRRPVTRFGAEALQIKNVLSRSRKYHNHAKLDSPVKSPKMGRNASRLIDVATRILEPGIQASNRARCSLTYPNSTIQLMSEVRGNVETQVSNAQAACRSCGNVLDSMDVRYNDEERSRSVEPPTPNFREVFFHGIEENRPSPAVYLENENDVVLLKTRYQPECVTPAKTETTRNEMQSPQCHEQISISRMFTSQKNVPPSGSLKHRAIRHGQTMLGDRVPQKSRIANTQGRRVSSVVNPINETKDFIALNRNLCRNRPRVPSKFESSVESDRRFCTGKNDSVMTQRTPVRKRRTLNISRPVDTAHSASSLVERQRSNKVNIVTETGTKIRPISANQSSLTSRSVSHRGNKSTDIVSFTFSSPVKSTIGTTSDELGTKRRDISCSDTNEDLPQEVEDNSVKRPSGNYLQVNGDALGALLEQKLKELSHQVENEAATGRTTASILQELISALTSERPVSCEDGSQDNDTKDSQSDSESQANLRSKGCPDGFTRGVNHLSPGCVLDASFSNDSCISSSMDDNSVPVPSVDVELLDLLDSASSVNKPRGCGVMVVMDLVNRTAAELQNADRVHSRLTATKLDYVQEIVLNSELLFGSNESSDSYKFLDFLLGPFLDELESLVIAAWKNSIILGIEVRKEENPLRRFLLDCLVECLDIKYIRQSNSGFKTWSRLPKSIDAELLIKSFDAEVRKWISFAGKSADEIIEREMSTSLGKWTDFEIEAFECGAEISQHIIQLLVDEIVTDLCLC
ncbi:uncharacterized protein LOC130802278 isoform X2 [Amaranthus tricolor]|uniref:uncharacterized protein LOC130802278 isoform X2 n=1 Tax=Amaranthus tricolor TaxID=29722 RepID=UPI00258C1963|nr:uncharacterized protein LOC130802278 isoform X2 [Amaranthus tricolor]